MFFVFFLLWILFNGRFTLEIGAFGIIIAAAMYAFTCRFMDYSPQKDRRLMQLSLSIPYYVVTLIYEILKANLAVIRVILSPVIKVEPVIVSFRTTLATRTARVVLANSITLTPGTITVSLEEDELTVHCLDRSFSSGMEDSVFVRLLERMERKLKG